jgi:hypothetical protein
MSEPLEQQFIINYMNQQGFNVPNSFCKAEAVAKMDIKGFEVWDEESFNLAIKVINEKYKNRTVVPFAGRKTNDDIVAFMISPRNFGLVVMYHAGTDPGYEGPVYYETFTDWLESVEDCDHC